MVRKKIKDFTIKELVDYCNKRFKNILSCHHCPFENCCACQFAEKLEQEIEVENESSK